MRSSRTFPGLLVALSAVVLAGSLSLFAQQSNSGNPVVPTLVNFSGVLTGSNGRPLTNLTGMTFSLYAEQQGGAPLWLETQNIQPDATGHYSVMLGSTSGQGLPPSLFVSGQARWLEVQAQGQQPQSRIMLLSVPYALKAGDAQTLNGQPASAFVSASRSAANGNGVNNNAITGGGTTDYLPLWLSKTKLGSSKIFQSSGGNLGIGTTSPAANLDVNGTSDIRNTLTLFPEGSAPALSVNGTAFEVSSKGLVTFVRSQTFPGTGDGTITGVTAGTDLTGGGASGNVTLNLDTTKVPQLAANNTFNGDNTFTGTATMVNGFLGVSGPVNTSVGYEITGFLFDFGIQGDGNAFLGFAGNTTMTGFQNTASGVYALSSNTTGGNNTADGLEALYSNTTGNYNTASGAEALLSNTTGGLNDAFGYQALYSNTTGANNDASGYHALYSNNAGGENTAIGVEALYSNTTGDYNTASGVDALLSNTTACCNTATGVDALYANTTGYENTAVGDLALTSNTTGSDLTCVGYNCTASLDGLTNATAIGAHAAVAQSNSLVLGGTGDYAVKVGIGTTKPSNILTIGRGAGHPVSDSWETYSSRRWKTNIETLSSALSKVEQLRGVSYDLKDSGKHEIGVIAEEVGAVVPEVVTYEDNGGDARGVDYSRLTALLIEATKEQQKLIRKQQEQIARLTAQVRAITASLKADSRTAGDVRTVKVQATVRQ